MYYYFIFNLKFLSFIIKTIVKKQIYFRSLVVIEVEVQGAAGQELGEAYKPAWNLGKHESEVYLAVIK